MRFAGWFFCWLVALPCLADEALLESISVRAAAIHAMQGQFEQKKYLGVLPQPIESTGRFQFSREQGIVWQTLVPIENTLVLNPNDSAIGKPQGNMASNQVVGEIFMQLLTGDFSRLQQWFNLLANQKDDNWAIELNPKAGALAAYIQKIIISGRDYSEQIIIHEQNGDRSVIHLLAESINQQPVTDLP